LVADPARRFCSQCEIAFSHRATAFNNMSFQSQFHSSLTEALGRTSAETHPY
jgi:hypothetical protein